jgi:hypothetical protein
LIYKYDREALEKTVHKTADGSSGFPAATALRALWAALGFDLHLYTL